MTLTLRLEAVELLPVHFSLRLLASSTSVKYLEACGKQQRKHRQEMTPARLLGFT